MPFILRDGNGDQCGRADGKEHGDGKKRVGKGNGEVDGRGGEVDEGLNFFVFYIFKKCIQLLHIL